jgi:hypothetical protein
LFTSPAGFTNRGVFAAAGHALPKVGLDLHSLKTFAFIKHVREKPGTTLAAIHASSLFNYS